MTRRNPEADLVVQITTDPDQADQQVSVVADQVLVATPADAGKIVQVAADGTLELAENTGGGEGGAAAAFSGARLYRTADQSIPNTTWTSVSWDAETFDTGGFHDPETNPERATVPAAGVYRVTFQDSWRINATGKRYRAIYKNGDAAAAIVRSGWPNADVDNMGYALVDVFECDAGDYFEAKVYQDSGGARALVGSTSGVTLLIEYLGPLPA